jgi:nucleoside-diphosphate-sugar epimerase
MNASQTVLLAGASGVFGRHITRTLTAAGYQVLGIGRGATNEIRADLLDHDALLRAVDGVKADVVVHAATALRKPPMRHKDMFATDDLRSAGTRNLLAAAAAAGARRFIGENIVFGYGYRDFGERILTETDQFGAHMGDKNTDRHLDGMRLKEELPLEAGIETISLRYGLFYGEGGTDAIVEMLRKRQMPVTDDAGCVLPWINLADAATAVLAAIEHGRPGQAYNIADDSPTGFNDMVRAVAEGFGTPKPLTLPRWAMTALPFARAMLTTSMRVSTEKAHRELGWQPAFRTIQDGIRAQIGQAR